MIMLMTKGNHNVLKEIMMWITEDSLLQKRMTSETNCNC